MGVVRWVIPIYKRQQTTWLIGLILISWVIFVYVLRSKAFTFPWTTLFSSGDNQVIKDYIKEYMLASDVFDSCGLQAPEIAEAVQNPAISLQSVSNQFHNDHAKANIVHQSWKSEDLPNQFNILAHTWRKCFPQWNYILWTDDDNRNFIERFYPWFLPKYDSYPLNIHRVDAVRYFYLYHYGGIYSDLDNECINPFEHLLVNYSLVFGAMEASAQHLFANIPEGLVQNSFMFSKKPRHPFWLEVINEIVGRNWGYPEWMTGPKVLQDVISKYRSKCGLDSIKIYPPIVFNPFSWADSKDEHKVCQTHHRMNSEQWKLCRKQFSSKSYVIQYHSHTWSN